MTIDASKFEAQGKPTREQARAVWDATPGGARPVAAKLVAMGYDISWRTLARWREQEWREPSPKSKPLAEKGKVKGVNSAIRQELQKIAEPSGLEAAVAPPAPTADELSLIEQRRVELMQMSEAQLDQAAAKARIVLNILMMEAAARRAQVMVLIPKETAALVTSFTEATKVGLSGSDGQPPSANDPKTIEGSAVRVSEEPPNETAEAIRKFKRKQMGEAA